MEYSLLLVATRETRSSLTDGALFHYPNNSPVSRFVLLCRSAHHHRRRQLRAAHYMNAMRMREADGIEWALGALSALDSSDSRKSTDLRWSLSASVTLPDTLGCTSLPSLSFAAGYRTASVVPCSSFRSVACAMCPSALRSS